MKAKSLLLATLATIVLVSCETKISSSSKTSVPPDSTTTEISTTTTTTETVTISAITGQATMLYGRSQTVTATVSNATDTGITWSVTKSSDDKDILSVTDAGVLTGVGIGVAKVVATAKADATKHTELEITVSAPAFADTMITVNGNFTLSIQYTTDKFLGVKLNDKGAMINSNYYWFADSKVFPVHFSKDKATSWYYTDEYITNSKKETIPDTTFKQMYNAGIWLNAATWAYAGYDPETKADYYDSEKDATDKVDYSLYCFSMFFNISSKADGFSELKVIDGKMVTLSFVTGTGENDGIALVNTYTDLGTTDLGITPTEKKFHDGGEAGDDDGTGEDF